MRQARLWATWVTMVAGAVAFWLLVFWGVAGAQATGLVVGKECEVSWTAPTVAQDGTALTGALAPTQANVYVTSSATPPAQGSPTAVLASTNAGIPTKWGCAGVAPGQHWVWVSYSNVNGEGLLTSLPFVLSTAIPSGPSGLSIK